MHAKRLVRSTIKNVKISNNVISKTNIKLTHKEKRDIRQNIGLQLHNATTRCRAAMSGVRTRTCRGAQPHLDGLAAPTELHLLRLDVIESRLDLVGRQQA